MSPQHLNLNCPDFHRNTRLQEKWDLLLNISESLSVLILRNFMLCCTAAAKSSGFHDCVPFLFSVILARAESELSCGCLFLDCEIALEYGWVCPFVEREHTHIFMHTHINTHGGTSKCARPTWDHTLPLQLCACRQRPLSIAWSVIFMRFS